MTAIDTTTVDARVLNWRFVVPGQPVGMLLLSVAGEAVPGAEIPGRTSSELASCLERRWPAVVVPDLEPWSAIAECSTGQLLARLGATVLPGGFIYAGFTSRLSPMRPLSRHSLLPRRAHRVLEQQGMAVVESFALMPSPSCAALMVPLSSRAELDYVLANLVFPYSPSRSALRGRLRQVALGAMRRMAAIGPHPLRTSFLPAHGLLAVRPTEQP